MTKPLPAWEMKNYSLLWKKFKGKEFTNKEAQNCLNLEDPHTVSVLFYNLNKKGWIIIKRDTKDQRKKIYQLKKPEEVVEGITE
jgi:DNA-binding MarR family transcriptional regulator